MKQLALLVPTVLHQAIEKALNLVILSPARFLQIVCIEPFYIYTHLKEYSISYRTQLCRCLSRKGQLRVTKFF